MPHPDDDRVEDVPFTFEQLAEECARLNHVTLYGTSTTAAAELVATVTQQRDESSVVFIGPQHMHDVLRQAFAAIASQLTTLTVHEIASAPAVADAHLVLDMRERNFDDGTPTSQHASSLVRDAKSVTLLLKDTLYLTGGAWHGIGRQFTRHAQVISVLSD